jgi:hypothetical protein
MDEKLAAELVKQNDNLREQLKQANRQIQELENEITVLKNVNNSI